MRLIDADALCDKGEILYMHTSSGKIIPASAVPVWVINNAPTVDAVSVVRCKDCSNTDPAVCLPDGMFYCNEWESTTRGHWYCCRGEKKEEVEDHDQS